jgi:hypothetical protein
MPENEETNAQEPTQTQSADKQTSNSVKAAKGSAKKRASKKSRKRRKTKAKKEQAEQKRRPGGTTKPYPTATFESVLPLARTILEKAGASREMKRATVFTLLGRAAESGPGRMLVINSAKYGLTVGGRQAEDISITDNAVRVLDQSTPPAESMRAKFALAIQGVEPFNQLYEKFKGGRLPAFEVMLDALQELDADNRQECVDIFVGNAKYIGLLQVIGGAEWLLDVNSALERACGLGEIAVVTDPDVHERVGEEPPTLATNFDSICFFMAPIGEDGSPERKHSDMVLEQLVAHAIKPLGLQVVRADKITKPGMISKQIIEHILYSKIAIVDLSFHNPNVFYELAVRHLLGKPIVHLIRNRDKIPFDVGNFRTISIDDSDMYNLIAKLESYRVDIANHVREALEGPSSADNPLLTFFPELKVTLSNVS